MGRAGIEPATLGSKGGCVDLGWLRFPWSNAAFGDFECFRVSVAFGGLCCPRVVPIGRFSPTARPIGTRVRLRSDAMGGNTHVYVRFVRLVVVTAAAVLVVVVFGAGRGSSGMRQGHAFSEVVCGATAPGITADLGEPRRPAELPAPGHRTLQRDSGQIGINTRTVDAGHLRRQLQPHRGRTYPSTQVGCWTTCPYLPIMSPSAGFRRSHP